LLLCIFNKQGRADISTTAQQENWAVLLLFFGTATLLGSFGWQTFCWLRLGNWPSFDIITLLSMIYPQNEWIDSPLVWLGLHKALSFLHTGITVGVPSIFYSIWLLHDSQRQFDNKSW
jgi:hypothetical protein